MGKVSTLTDIIPGSLRNATATTATVPIDIEKGERIPLITGSRSNSNNNLGIDSQDADIDHDVTSKRRVLTETLMKGVSVAAVGTGIAAMVIESSPSIYISAGIGAGVAPYASLQEGKIRELQDLKELSGRVQHEVESLKEENERLIIHARELEESAKRTDVITDTLKTLEETGGHNINIMEDHLHNSEAILKQMEKSLRSSILHNITEIVIRADVNQTNTLNKEELHLLVKKLKHIHGVNLNDTKLMDLLGVKDENTLRSVMNTFRSLLLNEDSSHANEIFGI